MKLTKNRLKEIIKEEILNENYRTFISNVNNIGNILDDLEMNDGMGMSYSQHDFIDELKSISVYFDNGDSEGPKELKKMSTKFNKIKKEIMNDAQKLLKQTQNDVKKLDKLFSKLK